MSRIEEFRRGLFSRVPKEHGLVSFTANELGARGEAGMMFFLDKPLARVNELLDLLTKDAESMGLDLTNISRNKDFVSFVIRAIEGGEG